MFHPGVDTQEGGQEIFIVPQVNKVLPKTNIHTMLVSVKERNELFSCD